MNLLEVPTTERWAVWSHEYIQGQEAALIISSTGDKVGLIFLNHARGERNLLAVLQLSQMQSQRGIMGQMDDFFDDIALIDRRIWIVGVAVGILILIWGISSLF